MTTRTRALGASLLLGLGLGAWPAHADVGDEGATYSPGKAVRRSDFAAGLGLGAVLGSASGYPNELSKLNDSRYEASTGFAAGPGGSFWVGGALRDWAVIGVGLHFSSLSGSGLSSTGTAFIFHLEGYPAFSLGGPFQDLGVFAEFGAGGRTIRKGTDTVADGGLLSVVSVGSVYEVLRLGGHLSGGPMIQLRQEWSESLATTSALAGFRLAFYGGPS